MSIFETSAGQITFLPILAEGPQHYEDKNFVVKILRFEENIFTLIYILINFTKNCNITNAQRWAYGAF